MDFIGPVLCGWKTAEVRIGDQRLHYKHAQLNCYDGYDMARTESDREDLLREAKALVERAELQVAGLEEPVVVGFRRDGAASVFFGADPVYQFNAANELRRAYVGGLLFKAEMGTLVELRRERREREIALVRRALNGDELSKFLAAMQKRLGTLRMAFDASAVEVIGQVPPTSAVIERIRRWVNEAPDSVVVAQGPNVQRSAMRD